MAKVRNVPVRVAPPKEGENPYKRGTHKFRIFQWALEQGEFTKVEFLAAETEIFESTEQESAMLPEIRSKAWWNEFYNKHHTFELNESE